MMKECLLPFLRKAGQGRKANQFLFRITPDMLAMSKGHMIQLAATTAMA